MGNFSARRRYLVTSSTLAQQSVRPAIPATPNRCSKLRWRISPSISRVRCRDRARVMARFAATVLFPSSRMVLVINNFFNARCCCMLLRRAPSTRIFSAPKVRSSVIATNRWLGAAISGSRGTRSRLEASNSSCSEISTAAPAACGSDTQGMPAPPPDCCRASKTRLTYLLLPRDSPDLAGLWRHRLDGS